MPRSRGGAAPAMGKRPRTSTSIPARCRRPLEAAGIVLDREERNQDDCDAVVAGIEFRPAQPGHRRLSRSNPQNASAKLSQMALGTTLRAVQAAIPRIVIHSWSLTGETDKRERRTSSIFERLGSALIALSVTGPSGFTGSTATDTQFASFGSGWAPRLIRIIPPTCPP